MDDCSPEQKAQEQLELRKAVRRLMEYLERKRQGRLVERHSGLSAADMEKLIRRMGTDSVLRLMFELPLKQGNLHRLQLGLRLAEAEAGIRAGSPGAVPAAARRLGDLGYERGLKWPAPDASRATSGAGRSADAGS